MRSLIARSLTAAERQQTEFRHEARLAGAGAPGRVRGVSSPGLNSEGAGGGVNTGRYSQSSQHHADQYGYYTGYPFAIISNIANRLAAQPIRVARILPKGRTPSPERRVKHAFDGSRLVPKNLQEMSDRLEILPNHKINRALSHPNPVMVRHHLLYVTFASIEITGLGYWWMYTDKATGRAQIWPIPSHWISPVHEDGALFHHYRLSLPGTGQQIDVPTKQIVPFLMPDPSDPFGAYPVMQAMSKSVMTDWAFEVAQRMSLENGINPGLAIMVGKPPEFAGVGGDQLVLTQDQRNQIIGAVRRQYRGVTRFDEPMILDALIKDVKQITTSPREMAFKDSGPLVRNRLCQGWGMNPITLGEIENVNYASSGVADHHVCRNVFLPRTEVNSQTMTRFVGPYFGGQSVTDDSEYGDLVVYQEPVQPSDPEMEMRRDHEDYDRGIVSRNYIRAKRGLPPIKGGDFAFVSGSQSGGWVSVGGKDEDAPKPPVGQDTNDDGKTEEGRDDGGDGDAGDDEDAEDKSEPRAPGGAKRITQPGALGGKPNRPSRYEWWRRPPKGTKRGSKGRDAQGHEHGPDGRFGSTGGGKVGSGDHGTGHVDHADAEHAERARGFMKEIKKIGAKAVQTAKHLATRAHQLSIEISWHVMTNDLASDICDTSHDYSKIINAKGTGDWLSQHLGVSGGFAAKAGSVLLSYAYTKLKQHVAARKTRGDGKAKQGHLTIKEAARIVLKIQHGILGGMGCPDDKLPSLAEVEKWLVGRHDELFGGAGGGADDAHDEDADKGTRPTGKRGGKKSGPRLELAAARKAAALVDGVSRTAEQAVRAALLPVFEKLGAKAAKRVREHLASGGRVSPSEVAAVAVDRREWEAVLTAELRGALADAVTTGAATEWALFRAFKVSKAGAAAVRKDMPRGWWDAVRQVARDVADKGVIRTVIDTVIGLVRRAVKGGADAGKAGTDLADHVNSAALIGPGAAASARAVARNEGAMAVNAGQNAVRAQLERHGAVALKQWVSMRDARVRASHAAADGLTARTGTAFTVNGFECLYPCDPALPAAERAYCRCRAVTIYK